MPPIPDTKVSLILRLRNRDDALAWNQFVEVYDPVIERVARKFGLQPADARETVQEVLIAVARAVGQWEPAQPVRFRSWLFRIVRSKTIDHLRKRSRQAHAAGSGSLAEQIEYVADPKASLTGEIDREYRRQLFRMAAREVKQAVKPATWEAFWLTSVDGQSPDEAAERLEISVGAVYIARSRVLMRLKQWIAEYER